LVTLAATQRQFCGGDFHFDEAGVGVDVDEVTIAYESDDPSAAPSGATWRKTVPKLRALMRASVTRTISVTPWSRSGVGIGSFPLGHARSTDRAGPLSTRTASLEAVDSAPVRRGDLVGVVHDVRRTTVTK